jgi:predicted NACHT family NTPase
VLFHRLRDGRLWGEPARDLRRDTPDDLADELRKYLTGVAERAAGLSPLFPERLRKPAAEGTPFDRLRQQVRVLQDRTALQRALAAEREQMRARGLDPDALAYTPGRGRADREADEGRREVEQAAVPRAWDEQAAGSFRRAVILADPGFGKTWLLRHEARRVACRALERLDQASPEAVEVPIFRRLSDLARTDGGLDQDLVALAGAGRSEGFRKWLRGRLEGDRCVILLDALDEVPEERPDPGGSVQFLPRFRQRLRQRVEDFARAFPRPRLLLTSRVVGYAGSPIPGAEELELMPFGQEETEAFATVWFGDREKARPFLDHLVKSPAVRGLAHIPLMLLLLCRSFKGKNKPPSRRADLYHRCLHGLLGEWKGERQGRQVGAAEIDPLLDVLGGVACSLFRDGYEQFREDDLFGRIATWQEENPRHPYARHEPDKLLQEFQQSGVLVRSGDDSDAPWLFLHRTFQEYLTARALAQRAKKEGWKALAGPIDRKCWLPEWGEVVALLAGELEDPEPLLALLCDGK